MYTPTPHKITQLFSPLPLSSQIRAMEESFRVRIDKIFGSLSSSSASSSPLSSLWCLADDEIDKTERSGGEKEPSGSRPEENVPEDLSVDEDEGQSSVSQKPSDYNDEEWEIKSLIGMDTTLDMEEEEDENDKVAVGEELYSYTKDVNDYETEADDWEELPASFKEREKDPRANLIAAELRLKEDAEAVNKLNSLHVSEVHEDKISMSTSLVVSEGEHVGSSDDNGLKPILKRKENMVDSKLQKRVRFSSDTRDENSSGGEKDSVMETSSPDEQIVRADYPCGIPDYMRNPSKYTRYTFDEGEVDEESNRKAYMEFLNMVRSRDEPLVEPLGELPTSVAFVPKRKPMAESKVENEDKGRDGRRGAVAVAVAVISTVEDNTVSAMEEDEMETAQNVIRRPGRQYRNKAREDEDE
ncbi:unnamed protein product [Microthlaspi erraticum]|uniref:U5 small nuclear ribonucleoprotein TSSC4 n=1 Tax=Microthlaspi erraticum TaxID=1685480 RepID=A0A6D2IXV6_9BRAS|nr:unnamed protein product [Microthlaspi erraticum]